MAKRQCSFSSPCLDLHLVGSWEPAEHHNISGEFAKKACVSSTSERSARVCPHSYLTVVVSRSRTARKVFHVLTRAQLQLRCILSSLSWLR